MKELHATELELETIDETLFEDVDIMKIYLSINRIQKLPSQLGNLLNLKKLYCNHNQLIELPRQIGNLINLEDLIVSHNQLTELPSEIGNLINLRLFWCFDNQIKILPSEIGNLINLKILNCSVNQLTNLPSEIGNLVRLHNLHIGNNQITNLPSQLQNLTNLVIFSYSNNPINHIPPNIIRFIQRIEYEHHNAQKIYKDSQNIHNHNIQECVRNSIKNILNRKPSIEDHIGYILQDSILDMQTKEALIEYSRCTDVHTELNITFDELLKYVISIIDSNDNKDEIKKILDLEIQDSLCKCFTGRISRLVNCLNGFDPEIVITISDSEQISQIILVTRDLLKDNYSVETHRELVTKELVERAYSSDIIKTWVDSIE